MMMATFAMTLAFGEYAMAATDAAKTAESLQPVVTPPHAAGFPQMTNCPTCPPNAWEAKSCQRDQKPSGPCPATYEKVVDGAGKTETGTESKPASK